MRIGYNRDKTEEYDKRFSVVILAAGLSKRMQAFKPLLPVDGRPAIEGMIEAAKAAGIADITVVTGHNREQLQSVLTRRARQGSRRGNRKKTRQRAGSLRSVTRRWDMPAG